MEDKQPKQQHYTAGATDKAPPLEASGQSEACCWGPVFGRLTLPWRQRNIAHQTQGDVDVYALCPWRRQCQRHLPPPRPPLRPPAAPGAERATQASLSCAACRERGLAGRACRYGCSCGCYCLEIELESAEAAVQPKPILENVSHPRATEGSPATEKPGHPLGCPSTPRPQVLSQDLSVLPVTPD